MSSDLRYLKTMDYLVIAYKADRATAMENGDYMEYAKLTAKLEAMNDLLMLAKSVPEKPTTETN